MDKEFQMENVFVLEYSLLDTQEEMLPHLNKCDDRDRFAHCDFKLLQDLQSRKDDLSKRRDDSWEFMTRPADSMEPIKGVQRGGS
jgi:hypothetical protein